MLFMCNITFGVLYATYFNGFSQWTPTPASTTRMNKENASGAFTVCHHLGRPCLVMKIVLKFYLSLKEEFFSGYTQGQRGSTDCRKSIHSSVILSADLMGRFIFNKAVQVVEKVSILFSFLANFIFLTGWL